MSVYILATLDTKGIEAAFVRDRLRELGVETTLVDCGCRGAPSVRPDIAREEIFAGDISDDRGTAVTTAAAGAARLITQRYAEGKFSGVLGLGGSAGTTIGTAAMRALPIGVPKLMVSTLASGQTRQYVGAKDILMLNAVVDIAGLNGISRQVLDTAARAMAGMAKMPRAAASTEDRPLIAATMFGVTTPCVERARQVLERAGYEVLVFHATGSGGQAMESLIDEGLIAGVLDITTTELADEIVGGFLTAGADRLTAAARRGIPQVVSVGATDMVNFYALDSVPDKFRDRKFHPHNSNVTLMRTTSEENARIGADLASKVAASRGPATIILPMRGVSALDAPGQPFDDLATRQRLFDAIRSHAGSAPIIELDLHLNDAAFAEHAANELLALMQQGSHGGTENDMERSGRTTGHTDVHG
ncbi:MAG TPA: Tm-1-like ATP-binding domain-containing protein [Pirellulales bacterium]|jgi:uncharacterized protein (UPF0261 family)|nr:Tm-1-like ATP-binding domain-containing protein [Pirellulales bacterium]